MRIAYIRVSSADQNEARQLEAIKPYNVERIFSEKISGKNIADREQLKNAMDFLRDGDTLYVSEFSRLARNTVDLLSLVQTLNDKGVAVVSVKENFDTSTSTGRLMLGVLASVAEFERCTIRERQAQGIALAKEAGKYKGRISENAKLDDATWNKYYEMYRNREINKGEFAMKLEISRPTLNKILAERTAC